MLRTFPPIRLSTADVLNAALRTSNLLLTGTGNATFQCDTILPSSFVIRDMVLSGNGTVTIGTSSETKLSIPVNGTVAISLQSAIPLVKGHGLQISFTGTGTFTLNFLGFAHVG